MFKELKLKNQLKHVNDALMGQMNIICLKNKNKFRCSNCGRIFNANELKTNEINKNKVRIHESIDDKFADFPDDQRYYKGTKVRILDKEPSDKEKMIWIQKKDGTEEEVEMDELAMSSEDSLDNKKPSNEISTPANGQRGEMTSKS